MTKITIRSSTLCSAKKDWLPPDKSNAFWIQNLSDFDWRCSRLTITCAIKVLREQKETSCQIQALQLLKAKGENLDDYTHYSNWLDYVMTSTTCVHTCQHSRFSRESHIFRTHLTPPSRFVISPGKLL